MSDISCLYEGTVKAVVTSNNSNSAIKIASRPQQQRDFRLKATPEMKKEKLTKMFQKISFVTIISCSVVLVNYKYD